MAILVATMVSKLRMDEVRKQERHFNKSTNLASIIATVSKRALLETGLISSGLFAFISKSNQKPQLPNTKHHYDLQFTYKQK
jgi:hypothetical protein